MLWPSRLSSADSDSDGDSDDWSLNRDWKGDAWVLPNNPPAPPPAPPLLLLPEEADLAAPCRATESRDGDGDGEGSAGLVLVLEAAKEPRMASS